MTPEWENRCTLAKLSIVPLPHSQRVGFESASFLFAGYYRFYAGLPLLFRTGK